MRQGQKLSREEFFHWLWEKFQTEGLLGVHEGTVLTGDEVTLDSGEAPRERDWIEAQKEVTAELYFDSKIQAVSALAFLRENTRAILEGPFEQIEEDWNAQWKAHFLSDPGGVAVRPFWRVIPHMDAQVRPDTLALLKSHEKALHIIPGAGFGTGTHETTKLCLQILGELAEKKFRLSPALDFGSGSGILAIGAAILGAEVWAVEIDPLAVENAKTNAELNSLTGKIHYAFTLENQPEKFSLILANILKPVLLHYGPSLCEGLAPSGALILSGLISEDVSPILECYQKLLPKFRFQIYEQNEWRAILGIGTN